MPPPAPDPVADAGDVESPALRWVRLALLVLVAYRLAYHATYLGEVPFAHGTFADGAMYEAAARDIVEHPPLGTEPFYLQGAYAYLLAIGMSIRTWASFGLIGQLLLAAGAAVLLHRSVTRLWGPVAGGLCTLAYLAHPGFMFYENKYLSAELGIACNIAVIAAFVGLLAARRDGSARRRWLCLVALGIASGLAVLARPNLILAVPLTIAGVFVVLRGDPDRRQPWLAAATVAGCALLAIAPMAARNLAVTGYPDIQPVHGGGTSFFIGNNPKSKGTWNSGGLLSARLGTESAELGEALGIDPDLDERAHARAIGDALYRLSLTWIREHPGDFATLEARKTWRTFGDQQLSHDYDWLGERELIPWAIRGLSFSLLLALGLLGAGALASGWRSEETAPAAPVDARARIGLALVLAGLFLAPLAANLIYFTSAQHRLPLALPAVILAGPGTLAAVASVRARFAEVEATRLPWWAWVLAVVAVVQGPWTRIPVDGPSSVHYYNLGMVQDQIGEPLLALEALDRAVEMRPDNPIYLVRRAHLLVRLGALDAAERDLDRLEAADAPTWVHDAARLDRITIAIERAKPPGANTRPPIDRP